MICLKYNRNSRKELRMTEVKAPQGLFEGSKFYFPVRIYYEDTDAGGIVYYANYLKFAERARTEFLRALGEGRVDEPTREKKGFIVRRAAAEYLKSAYLGDLLSVSCDVVEVKGASVEIRQEIRRGEELLTEIKVTAVYFDFERMRPTRIPAEMLQKR